MREIAKVAVAGGGAPYRQDIEAGRHRLVADEPQTAGGADAGPAPYQYLLAGLGACTSMTLYMYAERKQWNIGKLDVALTLSKDGDGNAYIDRRISSDAKLDDTQWQRLLEIAEKTPVTLTVKAGAKIATQRV